MAGVKGQGEKKARFIQSKSKIAKSEINIVPTVREKISLKGYKGTEQLKYLGIEGNKGSGFGFLLEFFRMVRSRELEQVTYSMSSESIGRKMRDIERGVNKNLVTDVLVTIANELGMEVVVVPRGNIWESWVDGSGYVNVERLYAPYVHLRINPDDIADFKLTIYLFKVNLRSIYICFRKAYLFYFKEKINSKQRQQLWQVVHDSVNGKNNRVKLLTEDERNTIVFRKEKERQKNKKNN